MPSASNNQSNTKLVKQTSVNSVNSGGGGGTSNGSTKSNKKIAENTTKSNSSSPTNNTETSSINTVKEDTSNVVAAHQQQQNSKTCETSPAANGTTSANGASVNKDAGVDALNPLKLTFTTIEHKIRNLEKRKTKLEGYRALQASGLSLSSDQLAAVAKYDAVMATLEFARDLVKQMQQFTKDAEKEQRKQARKDLIAKAQAETIKIREVLIIQNILSCFTDDAVRNDFLAGENGATKLENSEMDILEKFCADVQTRRPETSEDVPFATSAQKAAEIFSMTIDARPKQYGETTYENVKGIFHRVQESDYLDKIYLTDVTEPEIKALDDEADNENLVNDDDAVTGEINDQEQEINAVEEGVDKLNIEASGGNMVQMNQESPVVDNVAMMSQLPQPAIIKDHLVLQQQQPVGIAANISPPAVQPLMTAPMAPPATAVPTFQPTGQGLHSDATTPVHVAMFHPSMQQPTPQQLQQIPNATIIGGVPQGGQLMQQTGVQGIAANNNQQQQRQMLNSPAGQPGVATGPIALHNHNAPQQPQPLAGHFNPTTVHAVEQNFFKHQPPHPQQQQPPQQQHQQQTQYVQQMRPLSDVIGNVNFYFLQDSELDSPDINHQGVVPQNAMVFEQQQQANLQQNKNSQNVTTEQTNVTSNQQQQLQQINQQLPSTAQQQQQPQQQSATQQQQQPIQTQTFTNQSFPQMPPHQQQQHQHQQQQSPQQQQAAQNVNLMQSNTPSPLFQQPQQQPTQTPQQQQQQKVNNAPNPQLFAAVQTQNVNSSQQQQQSHLIMAAANEALQQQQPQNLMMMNRLTGAPTTPLMHQQQGILQQQQQQQITPQNLVAGMQQQQLPTNANTTDLSQTPKGAGFPFENPVVAGLSYEQQMQNKLNAEKVLNALQEASVVTAAHLHKNDLINEWDDAVLKGTPNSITPSNPQDYKSSAAAAHQVQVESSTKWSAEVNANSPITVQQSQTRKNEWTSSSANANNSSTVTNSDTTGSYVNDNRTESNHWHSQDSGSYGRGSSGGNRGQGGPGNSGGYQRQRNDDRRDDRRPGGGNGGGGGYRGRSNYPQQNGPSRQGGGGNSSGIYFRNNENASNNSYYQNGTGGGGGGNAYSNKDSRYDSRGGNYRGPRGSDNNSASGRSNGPPPRHMGNRSSGGGGGGNANNTNSNSYMNSRQSSNRLSLGVENKH